MKTHAWFAFVLLTALGTAAQADDVLPFLVGPRAGLQLHHDTNLDIGVEARFGILKLGDNLRLDIRPEFNYVFVSNGHIFDISGDVLFAIDVKSDFFEPYAGAGLGLFNSGCSLSVCGDSVNKLGVNLIGGTRFVPKSKIQFFAELRLTLGDIDPYLIAGGVLFSL
jgi:hypothetical protein